MTIWYHMHTSLKVILCVWCSNWFKIKSVEMSSSEEKRINLRISVSRTSFVLLDKIISFFKHKKKIGIIWTFSDKVFKIKSVTKCDWWVLNTCNLHNFKSIWRFHCPYSHIMHFCEGDKRWIDFRWLSAMSYLQCIIPSAAIKYTRTISNR